MTSAHTDYLARAGTPARPADLARHAALLYALSATGPRWTLTRGKRSETVRVSGPLQANNSLALRSTVLQGLGLARIPLFTVGEDLSLGRLVKVWPEWELASQDVHALTTSREYLPRKTRAFIDFFRGRIGDPPYWEQGRPVPA